MPHLAMNRAMPHDMPRHTDSEVNAAAILGGIKELPRLPEVVQELMHCIDDDDVDNETIAGKLARDPALSMKALRLANSSFYGPSRQIQCIPEALKVLGRRTVGLLVLAAAASDALRIGPESGLDFKAFWRHAVGAALSGQALARCLGGNPDAGFTVGLLHDIGQLALAFMVPQRYAEVHAYQEAEDLPIEEAERKLLGTDHAHVGAMLAEKWLFAPDIVQAIAHHHNPALNKGPGLTGVAHMADAISHALGLSESSWESVPATPPDVWNAMFPGNDACLKLFSDVESQFQGVCAALQV